MTTLIQTKKVYDEFIDFIAKGTTSESLTKFQFSESAKEQIEELIDQAKNGDLSPTEKEQLNQLLIVEHIIRLAKAKAHFYLETVSQ